MAHSGSGNNNEVDDEVEAGEGRRRNGAKTGNGSGEARTDFNNRGR